MKHRIVQIFTLVLSLLLGFTACHKHADTKAGKHLRHIKHSNEAITINEDDLFDFTCLDTAYYYLGEVNDSTYFFKIDNVKEDHIYGRFYLVNESSEAEAHRFEVQYKDNEYLFCTNTKDIPVKFKITIDTNAITGTFSNSTMNLSENVIAFEKYYPPTYVEYHSVRYNQQNDSEMMSFKICKDIQYGQAQGFWSTNPVNDEKYGKIIARSMARTISERDVDLNLDLYLPENDSVKKRPLLVLIHGGAFYIGDKAAETMTTWCEHFAKLGYVVATINYRMGFHLNKKSIQQCGYEAMQDAHAAIRYLVSKSDEYGIDPNYIFVGGTSAGAITALGVAFMTNSTLPAFVKENHFDTKLGGLDASSNNCKNTFRICALANMWGAVYDLSMLNGHNTPVISFHGTDDNIVPFDQGFPFEEIKSNIGEKLFDKMYGSKAIHERLDSLHIRNEFYPIEGVKHAPYQDRAGHPNSTYFFIQDKMEKFFLHELVKMGKITRNEAHPQQYYLNQKDITTINWKVDGGFILSEDKNNVTILWRKDARRHTLTASGTRSNGCAFVVKGQS